MGCNKSCVIEPQQKPSPTALSLSLQPTPPQISTLPPPHPGGAPNGCAWGVVFLGANANVLEFVQDEGRGSRAPLVRALQPRLVEPEVHPGLLHAWPRQASRVPHLTMGVGMGMRLDEACQPHPASQYPRGRGTRCGPSKRALEKESTKNNVVAERSMLGGGGTPNQANPHPPNAHPKSSKNPGFLV